MNRQEPVIDSRFLKYRTLKDRVDLPWETVENLTKQTQTPIPTQVHVQSQPVAEIEPQPFEPQPLILTEAEKKALIARLAPAVEAALRENLKNTVEMAAENAVTRIKADLERSVASTIQQAVAAEVQKLDLSDIIKRGIIFECRSPLTQGSSCS